MKEVMDIVVEKDYYIKKETLEIEMSSTAFSYGEIFILQSKNGDSFTSWISCSVCEKQFDSFDIFFNHAIVTHLNKTSDILLKTENEYVFNEVLNNNGNDIANSSYDNTGEDKLEDNKNNKNYKKREKQIPNCIVEKSENEETISLTEIQSEKNFQSKKLLPRHCDKCNKTFTRPSALRHHLNVHLKNDNKMYECKICHAKFSVEQRDIYRSHKDAHKRLPCTLCEKTFSCKTNLANHLMIHKGIKDFKCTQCLSAFFSQRRLSDHIRKTHLTAKVPCQFCKKLFSSNHALKIHTRIHTGEKPFVCEQCGSTFQTNHLLQTHIKRHNNDRRYECDVCGKKFLKQGYLRDHQVTHTDEKPYECIICKARFNSRPALIKHKKLHSGVKNYKCKICGKAYAQGPGLYAHMKSHKIAEEKLL